MVAGTGALASGKRSGGTQKWQLKFSVRSRKHGGVDYVLKGSGRVACLLVPLAQRPLLSLSRDPRMDSRLYQVHVVEVSGGLARLECLFKSGPTRARVSQTP